MLIYFCYRFRFSYHQRIVDIVPDTFEPLVPKKPVAICKYEKEGAGKDRGEGKGGDGEGEGTEKRGKGERRGGRGEGGGRFVTSSQEISQDDLHASIVNHVWHFANKLTDRQTYLFLLFRQ